MKTSHILTGIAGASLCIAGLTAPAAASTTITSGTTTFDLHDAGNGLLVYANPLSFTGTLEDVGDSFSRDVFTIGTNEGNVGLDDIWGKSFTAFFTFASPAGATGVVSGSTTGTFTAFGIGPCDGFFSECGYVSWDAPALVNFGNGGQFSLELKNTDFGVPGSANVKGKFTLLAPSIPEPSTWALMILGFGVVGFMMRSRRQNVTVSYA